METGYDILFFWVARMMMLGEWTHRQGAFSIVLLSGLDPRPGRPRRCPRRRATAWTRSARSTRSAPTRSASRSSTARAGLRPAPRDRNASRARGTSPTSCGTRPVRARRAPVVDPRRGLSDAAGSAHLDTAGRWLLSGAAATVEAVDARLARYELGEVTRQLTTRSGTSSVTGASVRQGAPGRRIGARGGARGDVVGAGPGARYVPAAARPVTPFITETLWARCRIATSIRSC